MHDADVFVGVAQQALWVTALVCAPLLMAALVIGLVIGIVQAATSINDATLSFVPKIIVVGALLALMGGMMLTLIGDYARDLFDLAAMATR